jgi:hypothetical protein
MKASGKKISCLTQHRKAKGQQEEINITKE